MRPAPVSITFMLLMSESSGFGSYPSDGFRPVSRPSIVTVAPEGASAAWADGMPTASMARTATRAISGFGGLRMTTSSSTVPRLALAV